MKIRKRQKIAPILVEPGDSLTLLSGDIPIMSERVKRKMVCDEAVIFDVERGDFPNVNDGIGGAFLSSDRKEQ